MKLKELFESTEMSVEDLSEMYDEPLINSDGNCNLCGLSLTSLKGSPTHIRGNFDCSENSLKNLNGGPEVVDGDFDCTDNSLYSLICGPETVGGEYRCSDNWISTLEGSPQETGNFFCEHCKLVSLKGAPRKIKNLFISNNDIESLKDVHKQFDLIDGVFSALRNPIKSHVLGLLLIKGITRINLSSELVGKILNKHIGKGRVGMLEAQEELIEAGLDDFAQL